MIEKFAKFEDQLNDFDCEINDIIQKNQEKTSNTPKESEASKEFEEIDKLLMNLKLTGE